MFNINVCHYNNITEYLDIISREESQLLDRRSTAGVEQLRLHHVSLTPLENDIRDSLLKHSVNSSHSWLRIMNY